jgi:hypothetical protein
MQPRRILLLAASIALCALSLAHAQEEDGERGRKRIEDYRRIRLIETLDFTEEQSARYFVREREFRQAENALKEQRENVLDHLRQLSKGNASEAEIMKDLQSLATIGTEMLAKRKEYLLGLKDILSIKQIAQLVIFEDAFAKELKRVLQNVGKRQPFRR